MIPAWKLAREWARFRAQLQTFVMAPVNRWRQCRYDAARDQLVTVRPGALPLSGSVAIVLVYQPVGLPDSVLHTLAHLRNAGFAPVTVLNAPLPQSDLDRLHHASALVVQRPNFGYDFGGYRDAILHLLGLRLPLERVAFLNDSIWFPVFPDCDHLDRMSRTEGDLVGYAYAQGLRRRKNAHVQSYFFMFKGAERLQSADFARFWTDLSIANSRHHTIRNAEMVMTAAFRERGWRIGWLFSSDDFRGYFTTCPDADLIRAAEYYIAIGNSRAPALRAALDGPVADLRARMLADLAAGNLGRNTIAGPPDLIYRHLGFAAMKKSAAHNYLVHRRTVRAAGLDAAFHPAVRAELAART